MSRKDIVNKIEKLNEENFDLGFPHEECRKISNLDVNAEWIIADLNTFLHSLWSLSYLKKVLKQSSEELEKDKFWLQKSFFERFSKYNSVEKFITPEFTPELYKTLEINEELRRLILILISKEIEERNNP